MAKQYISSKGKAYTDYDIARDETSRAEMVKLSGQMGVPVIVVDGKVIVGFDQAEIDKLIV
jgi:glutaredoxin